MVRFESPSGQFPPLPAIGVEVPDDWTPVQVPGALLAVRAALEPDRFAANVVVTATRLAGDFDVAAATALVQANVAAYPDAKVGEPFRAQLGSEHYVLVNVAYADPAAGTLVQVHGYCGYPVPGHDTHRDVVHVMGTCASGDAASDYPLLQQVMESVRVDWQRAEITRTR